MTCCRCPSASPPPRTHPTHRSEARHNVAPHLPPATPPRPAGIHNNRHSESTITAIDIRPQGLRIYSARGMHETARPSPSPFKTAWASCKLKPRHTSHAETPSHPVTQASRRGTNKKRHACYCRCYCHQSRQQRKHHPSSGASTAADTTTCCYSHYSRAEGVAPAAAAAATATAAASTTCCCSRCGSPPHTHTPPASSAATAAAATMTVTCRLRCYCRHSQPGGHLSHAHNGHLSHAHTYAGRARPGAIITCASRHAAIITFAWPASG